ncbi:MAG TPA: flagellin [Pirellulales bacterium]|nr:flagellin [Pirellulales bacterium]
MTRINTNLISLQAQNNLYNNEGSLQTSLERLSTGLRINSGADDPSGLIASSVLGSEVTDVGQAITNSQNANNIVATADAALSQVGTLLDDISGLVESSANSGAESAAEIAANQVQVDSAIQSIDRIGQTTVFGGDQLLNGSKAFNVTGNLSSVFQSSSDITVNSFNPALHTGSPNSDVSLKVTQSATQAKVNVLGNSQGVANVGLSNLSLDSGTTHATATLTTNNFVIGSTGSLNGLHTTSTRATQTITGASIAGLNGTSTDTLTLHVTGNIGSADVTVNVGGTDGIKTNDNNLINAINTVSAQTGVVASGSGGSGDVTLTSSYVGSSATVGVSATAGTYAGTDSSLSFDASTFSGFAGSGAGSLTFTVNGVDSTGKAKSVNVSLDASTVTTASAFASAVQTQLTAGGLAATVANPTGSTVTFTATQPSATPITITNVQGSGAGDAGVVTTAVGAGTSTAGTATDQAAFNAAVGTLSGGISGAYSSRTITAATLAGVAADGTSQVDVTITGDLGSQTITGQALAGTNGLDTASNLATLINNNTGTTGVSAVVSGGNVVISSTDVGATGTANVSFANYTGAASSSVINANNFGTLTGSGAGSLVFNVTGDKGTAAVSADASLVAAPGGAAYLQGLINAQTSTTGVAATVNSAGNIVLTDGTAGTTSPAFISGVDTSGGAAGDNAIFSADINQNQVTGAAADTTATAANAAVGSLTAGAVSSTTFTITGNEGTATVSTALIGGNDAIINNSGTNSGATALANLINTRTGTTGITASVNNSGNVVLTSEGAGSASVATVTATGSGNDSTIVSTGHGLTNTAGVDGTSNQTTLQVVGDLGRAVITVNNNDVINDSSALSNAINAVTAQTGVVASGSGAGGNVTLTSQDYGSAAQLSISAISATNANDIALFNAGGTQQTTNGLDVAGTVTTNQGTGAFTGQGANLSYTNSSINLTATTSPSLGQPTAATTTVVGNGGAGTGIGNLTAGADDSNTISFTVTGALGSANINGLNVAALQGDSRTLVDAINKVSQQTGVVASTQAGSGGSYALSNIVLSASTPGASGSVSLQATSATVAGDVTTFNAGGTFTGTAAGTNAPSNAVANFNVTGGALFQIGPEVNYSNQVNVNIAALDTNLLGRNVSTTGNFSLHDLMTGGSQSLSSANLSTAATIVQQAIEQVATLRGQLGALQANVLQSNITSQQTALEQVTSAQSTIQDADYATETASLTRAQVLVQADTSVLAIANQQPQSVLALLPHG